MGYEDSENLHVYMKAIQNACLLYIVHFYIYENWSYLGLAATGRMLLLLSFSFR